MKKLLLGAAVCIAAPAFAADLPPRIDTTTAADTAPPAVYDWTGIYLGGHIGGVVGGPDSLDRNNGRVLGGVQVGVDRQFATNWVIGSEVQFSGLLGDGGHGVLFPASTVVTGKTNVLASFTARVGYTWGPVLLYAKAGSAFRDNTKIAASTGGVPVAVTTGDRNHTGITVGGGLEYMFAPDWSAKVEYQYYNFGDSTFTGGPPPLVDSRFWNDEHTLKLGVNYRFRQGN